MRLTVSCMLMSLTKFDHILALKIALNTTAFEAIVTVKNTDSFL